MVSAGFVTIALLLGISIGAIHIPILSILTVLGEFLFQSSMPAEHLEQMRTLIISIRLPRVLLSFLVGAALAVSGAALQGLLKNPLADPYTLGVSSGASLGAVIVLFFHLQLPVLAGYTMPFISVSMALLTLIFIIFISTSVLKRITAESMILIGIILSSFLSAVISLLIALSGEELRQIVNWLLGSVSMRGWTYIKLFLPFFTAGMLILFLYLRDLNVLTFGDEIAQSLGVNVWRSKILILFGASLLTGGAVAVSGTIGFVGLVVPHVTRLYLGSNYRHLLPLSFLNGGSFLVLADLIARTIITPRELPIGVITALVGAPAFAVLFIRKYRN
ncbi:FecCD family ABC transporter permease [Priestia abyssalis]|uniref:FecCD family ABC transporter permease n=1 Tax=Priestia abyssalis TaxID=1221450 RepID=UPI000994F5E5|nr:iron ABC transporter permease [Priestia abyssalis]